MPAWVKERLAAARLYGILDLGYVTAGRELPVLEALLAGGVDLIQLRGKKRSVADLMALAAQLHQRTFAQRVPLIMNDHAAVAREIALEGVHVGQDDLPVAEVRAIVGREILVGKSTHSFAQAVAAAEEGADYIGFGPLFATPTKPDYAPIGLEEIARVHGAAHLPIFCIGGIKEANLARVVAAGAKRAVIVSELLQSADIEAYAKVVRALLPGA